MCVAFCNNTVQYIETGYFKYVLNISTFYVVILVCTVSSLEIHYVP